MILLQLQVIWLFFFSCTYYISQVCKCLILLNLFFFPVSFLHSNPDDEFEKFQKEVRAAEAEVVEDVANTLNNNDSDDDHERPSTPPDGEEEFTDDDGTTYKWDRGLRAWVPQVGAP